MEKAMLVLLVLALVAGCAAVEERVAAVTEQASKTVEAAGKAVTEVVPLKPTAGAVVLEVESFALTKAAVKPLKGASGGKTVVLAESGKAEASVTLPQGAYELVVVAFAPSLAEDAFYLSVGNQPETRLFPGETEKLAPSRPVQFTVSTAGPCKVVLSFAEENVELDRVEIRSVK